MKKMCLKLLFTIVMIFISACKVHAIQFDVLALPTELFTVCDNYFCYPEPSEIATNYIIHDLNTHNSIKIPELSEVRATLQSTPELKAETEFMLEQFKKKEKIDFNTLNKLSKLFHVKSVIIVSAYSITDKTPARRNLWEILEISSAFKISYPFSLITNVVLTDTVNDVIMWSAKYNKTVSDSNGYFYAANQAQAASHLEKIKLYYKDNVSKNVSQNIYLRFFPSDVRTFSVKKNENGESEKPKFVPNALDHLIKPQMIRELDEGTSNTCDEDELMFTL